MLETATKEKPLPHERRTDNLDAKTRWWLDTFDELNDSDGLFYEDESNLTRSTGSIITERGKADLPIPEKRIFPIQNWNSNQSTFDVAWITPFAILNAVLSEKCASARNMRKCQLLTRLCCEHPLLARERVTTRLLVGIAVWFGWSSTTQNLPRIRRTRQSGLGHSQHASYAEASVP